jgi:hypothetical protein
MRCWRCHLQFKDGNVYHVSDDETINHYGQWYTEMHFFTEGVEVTRMVAAHLVARVTHGSAVIICVEPERFVPTYRKRWKHLIRTLEVERSATNSRILKEENRRLCDKMQHTQFMADLPDERANATAWIVAPDEFIKVPKSVKTIYVTTPQITMQQMLSWANQICDGGVVLHFRPDPISHAAKK